MKESVVIITGGADGIGREVVREFLKNNYYVAVLDINEKKILECKSEFNQTNRFMAITTNTIVEEEVNKAVELIIEKFGRIDVLVNNVGGSFQISQSIEDIEVKDWDKVIDINLKSTFLCSKAVVPQMKKQEYGRIINISSMAGRSRSVFGGAPYATAKAAIIGFTRQISKDLGPFGITINAIAPGTVLSGERIGKYWESKSEDEKKLFFHSNPMGRLGNSKDISRAVLFLSHKDASYITGAVIDINGGMWVG